MNSKDYVKLPWEKYIKLVLNHKKQKDALSLTDENMAEFDNAHGLKFLTNSHKEDNSVITVLKIKNKTVFEESKYKFA